MQGKMNYVAAIEHKTQFWDTIRYIIGLESKREGLGRCNGKTRAVKQDLDPTRLRKEEDRWEGSLAYGSLHYILGGLSYSPYPVSL